MPTSGSDPRPAHPARWAESGAVTAGDLVLPLQVHTSLWQGWIASVGAAVLAVFFLIGGLVLLAAGKDVDDKLVGGAALTMGLFFAKGAFSIWRQGRLGLLYTFTRQGLLDHRAPDAVLRWAEVTRVDVVRGRHGIAGIWLTMRGAPGRVPWLARNLGWPLPGGRALGGGPTSSYWRYVHLASLTVGGDLLAELVLKLVRQESPGVKLDTNLVEALLGGGPRLT